LTFADLYDRAGLDGADADLHDRLIEVRRDSGAADRKAQAELLLALVPHVEDFMGDLFKIADAVRRLQVRHDELAPLYAVKRSFVQRRATKERSPPMPPGSTAQRLRSSWLFCSASH
jgi:hypothetical protein